MDLGDHLPLIPDGYHYHFKWCELNILMYLFLWSILKGLSQLLGRRMIPHAGLFNLCVVFPIRRSTQEMSRRSGGFYLTVGFVWKGLLRTFAAKECYIYLLYDYIAPHRECVCSLRAFKIQNILFKWCFFFLVLLFHLFQASPCFSCKSGSLADHTNHWKQAMKLIASWHVIRWIHSKINPFK